MLELSGTVGALTAPLAVPNTLAAQILAMLHQNPDRVVAPADLAEALGIPGERERVRMTLHRLMRASRVKRVAHGRYRIVPMR